MPKRFLASVLPQHEAAELYRLMVVGIRNVAVFLMDPGGHVTVWNKGAEDMQGYTADEAIGQHLALLYTEQERAAGRPLHNLCMAAEHGFYDEETWRRRKDGSLFWAHVAITALRDEHHVLLGFSKVTMDLTRHKLFEQRTRERDEIDMILNAAGSGTWKWHVEQSKIDVSSHLLQLLGYDGDQHVLSFDEWLGFVHRDDRARLRGMLEHAAAEGPTSSLDTEVRFRGSDRSFHWFFLRAAWHQVDPDEPLVFMGVCVGIDNLKAVEDEKARLFGQLEQERTRFSNILEQLPTGVLLASAPSGRVTYQNRASAELLGRSMDGIDSLRDDDNFHFLDASGTRIASEALPLARALQGKGASCAGNMVYERDDGTRLHLDVTSSAIVDNDGIARLAVAVLHDVTELKKAELAAATEKERALVTLAAITDGVITSDENGRIGTVNPADERMTGVRQKDAQGKTLHELLGENRGNGKNRTLRSVRQGGTEGTTHLMKFGNSYVWLVIAQWPQSPRSRPCQRHLREQSIPLQLTVTLTRHPPLRFVHI